MKKRLLSLLMAVLMTALLLPAEALAITGGDVRPVYMSAAPVTITKEGIDSGSQIYSMKMQNGKLVMFIATSGPHMDRDTKVNRPPSTTTIRRTNMIIKLMVASLERARFFLAS